LNAIRSAQTPPPQASRHLAILHAAIYDAVNGITRSHHPYFVQSGAPSSASTDAAASAAAREVLVAFFPAHAPNFDEFYAATLAVVPDGPHKSTGIRWGQSVADQILSWRDSDNSDAVVPLPSATGPGAWQPTPPAFAPYLLPQCGFVVPFATPTDSYFRPPGPPSLDSAEYAQDYNKVKALGAAVGSQRTQEQTLIALFWADGAGTETPPGHWNSIAQRVATQLDNSMEQNARLFALLNFALADAAICAWDAKYAYDFWRPITAIRSGATDGNTATASDPEWTPLIVTPPFPDYVSGHSTFSGAASRVLSMFYGRDDVAFTAGSDFLPGVVRAFDSFSAAATEAALSRLYAGIHFRSATEDGLNAGIAIGDWISTHYLQPKRNRSRK
jgi:PAP2 superfamily